MKEEYHSLIVKHEGPVLEVLLNRPEARNAVTLEMHDAIDEVLGDAAGDPEVKVVTFRGLGKMFSAGHDLKQVADWFTTPGGGEKLAQMGRVPRSLEKAWYFNKPIVAGVHGYVGPIAWIILAHFDFIIAGKGTRFSFEQTRMGAGLPLSPLVLRLPMAVYKKLAMMGGWLDAETAHRLDFVQRVVPEDQVPAETRRWADELARIPLKQLESMKRIIHRQYELMGLLSMVEPFGGGGHGAEEDQVFFNTLKEKGMRAALKFRDETFDQEVAKV